jgi:hypothetical protein
MDGYDKLSQSTHHLNASDDYKILIIIECQINVHSVLRWIIFSALFLQMEDLNKTKVLPVKMSRFNSLRTDGDTEIVQKINDCRNLPT